MESGSPSKVSFEKLKAQFMDDFMKDEFYKAEALIKQIETSYEENSLLDEQGSQI